MASSWPGSQSMITGVVIAHHLWRFAVFHRCHAHCRPPSQRRSRSGRSHRDDRRRGVDHDRLSRRHRHREPRGRGDDLPVRVRDDVLFYGLTTPQQDAGSDPTRRRRAGRRSRTSLQNTTYHYRLVATNTADPTKVSRGDDRSFKTSSPASAPSISSRAADLGRPRRAPSLPPNVTPRGLATTVRFEYGTSTSYGNVDARPGVARARRRRQRQRRRRQPPSRARGTTTAPSPPALRLLTVAGNRTFTTSKRADRRGHHAVDDPADLGVSGLTITGSVSGTASIPVALEKQDFPYTGAFSEIATANANSPRRVPRSPPLRCSSTGRLRVVTRTPVVAVSPVVTASVAVKVGLRTRRLKGKRLRVYGCHLARRPGRPDLAPAPVAQRQSGLPRAAAKPELLTGDRSRYTFTVARRSRAPPTTASSCSPARRRCPRPGHQPHAYRPRKHNNPT